MASTYSTNLGIELMGTGDQSGTWGATTNTNLGTLLEQAIAGYGSQAVADSASPTVLTISNGASSTGRNAVIALTGALTLARVVEVPAKTKSYIFYNTTTGGFAVTVKVTGQTGVSIPNGTKAIVYCDGTDVRNVLSNITVDSSGNVGIGTSSPTNTSGYTTLQLNNATNGGMLRISNGTQTYWNYVNSGGAYLGTSSNHSLFIQTNNTTQVTIDSSGNVGVGTTSPSGRLDVAGTQSTIYARSTGAYNSTLGFYSSTSTLEAVIASIAGGGSLLFGTGSSGTERMRIDSSGNLLVGLTTTPTSGTNTTKNIVISNDISLGSLLIGTNASFLGRRSSDGSTILNTGQANIEFSRGVYGSTTTSMVIDTSGNLSLGTSSSAGKITVMGVGALDTPVIGVVTNDYFTTPTYTGTFFGQNGNSATGTTCGVSNAGLGKLYFQNGLAGLIYTNGTSPIVFGTTATERMRIDSSGNLLVNTTTVLNNARVTVVNANPQIVARHSSATAGKYWNSPYIDTNNTVYIINQDNAGVYVADGATAWSANSDERLKDIIAPITSALEGVQSLRAVRYSWKADSDKSSHVGLIAQDVQKILPEVVASAKLPLSEDETEYLSVAYTEVIPLLVAAIQELSAKVTALESK